MKIGDLVRYGMWFGIVTYVDPEELGNLNEVEVTWHDGSISNHSAGFLELINEKD